MKTLGGPTFCWNGIEQDYCFLETLDCLYDLCDEVSVVYGGTDGTVEAINKWIGLKDWSNKRIHAATISEAEWEAQKGREKLSYFSNLAIDMLNTDWIFYLQCDEILHEDSFQFVREAIKNEECAAFFVKRLNLWFDPYHTLNVPQERKPCSSEVIRLTRSQFRCIDDAESVGVTGKVGILGDIDTMMIFHMGFVRDGKKHLVKIKNMLTQVFGWENDKRAENCDTFIPERFFSREDVVPIPRPLPKYIEDWVKERFQCPPLQS